ncbi:MAG: efflux RND transporter periplasmic adaptor subunit [Myxococcota bacterium]
MNDRVQPARTADEVRRTIGPGGPTGLRRWLPRIAVLLVLGAVVFGGWRWWAKKQQAADRTTYITRPAYRGELEASVSATGNLQARDQVNIGAEVSGTILRVDADFNDAVKKGDLLCELDPEQLQASRDQARAQLLAAEADYRSRRASAREASLAATRTSALAEKGLAAPQELEAARAAAARAKAAVHAAAAQVSLSRASLKSADTALSRAKIVSPIDGIVLSRSVEPGQTVAASFQAPVLFILAKDLRRMELHINIDEADIGRVKEGQAASFAVDAYPERTFPAKLVAIRNVATLVDNVVTYEAVLEVENEDRTLRPGMTALVSIVTGARKDVLIVPNAALRFTPPEVIDARQRARPSPFGAKRDPKSKAEAEAQERERLMPTVWTLGGDGKPVPHRLAVGMSDGQGTEVVEGDVSSGDALLVDVDSSEAAP